MQLWYIFFLLQVIRVKFIIFRNVNKRAEISLRKWLCLIFYHSSHLGNKRESNPCQMEEFLPQMRKQSVAPKTEVHCQSRKVSFTNKSKGVAQMTLLSRGLQTGGLAPLGGTQVIPGGGAPDSGQKKHYADNSALF